MAGADGGIAGADGGIAAADGCMAGADEGGPDATSVTGGGAVGAGELGVAGCAVRRPIVALGRGAAAGTLLGAAGRGV
jgi:hypothetical protein